MKLLSLKVFLPGALLGVAVVLTAQQPVGFYSADKEMALGRQMAAEFERNTTQVKDAILQQYVSAIGAKLMPQAPFPFQFRIVAGETCAATHEALGLPGGYVFVPSSLFLSAQGEAEFAGMLAHAMEHSVQRPAAATMPGTIPLIFVSGWPGSCNNVLVPMNLRPTLRTNEVEADRLAVRAMAAAGWDPAALISYVERVQRDDERGAAMRAEMTALPRVEYQVTRSEFAAMQERMARAVAGNVR